MPTAPWTEAIAEDPTIVSGALLALAAAPLSSSARMLMTVRSPGQKTMLLGVEPEGYVEDEDDAAALYDLGPSGEIIARGCPTCSGTVRRTVGMVCPACGKNYGPPVAPLSVPAVDVKLLRETLAVAQTAISGFAYTRINEHVDRIQGLIDQLDGHRPLGPDGKHGDLHTATCGCDL